MNRLQLHALLALFASAALVACDPESSAADAGRQVGDADLLRPDFDPPTLLDAAVEADADPLGPRLNSLIPSRGELAGGIRVRVIGREFRNGVRVEIGDRECTELEVESENHLRCTVPRGEQVGSVPVTVLWPGRDIAPATLEDGFTYFRQVGLEGVEPRVDSTRGGVEVLISGQGFVDPTEVLFGGVPARVREIRNLERMVVVAPPHEAGTVEVRVRNVNGDVRLPAAFTYTEEIVVDAVSPRVGTVAGGDEVRITGGGLLLDSVVRFGAGEAQVLASELGRQRLTVRTPPGAPGLVDVQVANTNGEAEETEAFLYVPAADGPFAVLGVVPTRLPDTGNHPFQVGGNGFTDAARVFVDGQRVPCERRSGQVLDCRSPLHDPGVVDVRVEDGDNMANLPDALRFFPAIEVFDVRPGRGSRSGGTLVELRGRGFSPTMRLAFDGSPLALIEVASPELAFARTPPGREGVVNLVARTEDDVAFLPEAFEYFDPSSRFGGVWGDPLGHSLNVTVYDGATGDPVPDARVMALGLEEGERWVEFTNGDGQTVVSDRDLESPVSVTVSKEGYEVFTIERVTAENVTVYITPYEIEISQGPPRDPIPPSRVSGTVRGLDLLEKPLEPGVVLAAFVDTTHTSMFNRSSLPWAEPNGVLLEDGPFEIFCRPGQIAVVVTAGYISSEALADYRSGDITYWGMRDQVIPLAMGYQRYISVSPGDHVEDITVVIDKPMDLDVPVTLDNPSGGVPGAPSLYDAEPIVDFGAEGYWSLDTATEGPSPQLLVRHMPDFTDWEPDVGVYWISNARQPTVDWLPYTTSFEWDRDMADGVTIGPFVGTPHITSPEDGGMLGPWRLIAWELYPGAEGPTEPADANIISLTSFRGVPLWTHITPGPVTQVVLPVLPEDLGLDADGMNLTIVPVIVDRRFDFEDFGLGDLGFSRRASYGVARARFSP
ncbi:MAG: IPT/TIG domain-containing protein [Myxococcales bacterium]|nr:IPT/TIG domain-containing protein [Myxococcales bacterium]